MLLIFQRPQRFRLHVFQKGAQRTEARPVLLFERCRLLG
jgi:hypothetical protein